MFVRNSTDPHFDTPIADDFKVIVNLTEEETVYLRAVWARVKQSRMNKMRSAIKNLANMAENDTLLDDLSTLDALSSRVKEAEAIKDKSFLYCSSEDEMYIKDFEYLEDVITLIKKDAAKNAKADSEKAAKILKQIQSHATKCASTEEFENDINQLKIARGECSNPMIVSVLGNLSNVAKLYGMCAEK